MSARSVDSSQFAALYKKIGQLLVGSAGSLLVLLISAPLLTRLYSPTSLGEFGTHVAVATILATVLGLRYELAIPMAKSDAQSWSILYLALTLNLTVGAAFVVVAAAVLSFAGLAGLSLSATLVVFAVLSAVTIAACQSLTYQLVRQENYQAVARSRLIQALVMVLAQVSLAFHADRSESLMGGYLLSQLASLGYLVLKARLTGTDARYRQLKRLVAVARRFRRFPLFLTWSSLLNAVAQHVPLILFAAILGPEAAGFMSLTQRAVATPLNTLSNAVGQVYLGIAGKNLSAERREETFRVLAKRLLLLALPVAAGVAIFGIWGVPIAFGEGWRRAGLYAILLLPMFIGQFLAIPFAQSLNIYGRQDLQAAYDALKLTATVAAIGLPHLAGGNDTVVVGTFGIALAAVYAANVFANLQVVAAASRSATSTRLVMPAGGIQ